MLKDLYFTDKNIFMFSYIPLDKLGQDFLFEDLEKNICTLSRKFLEDLAAELKLKYLATIIKDTSFKEVYHDEDCNIVVFSYAIKHVDIILEKAIVKLSCLTIDSNVEMYVKSKKSYRLNIRPLLECYVSNEKIFDVADEVCKDFKQKQSYIS